MKSLLGTNATECNCTDDISFDSRFHYVPLYVWLCLLILGGMMVGILLQGLATRHALSILDERETDQSAQTLSDALLPLQHEQRAVEGRSE